MNEKEIRELRRMERIKTMGGIKEKVVLMLSNGIDDLVLFSHWLDEIIGLEMDIDATLLLQEWGLKERKKASA